MRIIAVVNQKGGCGKTTVSINLASALAAIGQKTLLVDMDPQSHCAVGLAVPEEQIEQSIYDVLISNIRNEPIKLNEILWQISDKLELAPSSIDLSAFETQMAGVTEKEFCLKKVLEKVNKDFDFCIIDCPPAVGLLTFNALKAATDVIVPVETGYFSLHGLSKQLETLDILYQNNSHPVNIKVLASMYDIRTRMAREVLSELRSHFGDKMFKTSVNFNTKIKEAASFGQPISEYDPNSKGQADFNSLAKEVLGTTIADQRKEMINSLSAQLESISSSADELIKAAKPTVAIKPTMVIEAVEPAKTETPVAQPAQPVAQAQPVEQAKLAAQPKATSADLDKKLSDYYGVNQMGGAVVFVTLYPRANSVQIAGDFNNWQPEETSMEKVGTSGVWQTKIKLPSGKHQYRLVVDGQWQQDPYNENSMLNPFGEYNSVVEVC